MLANKYYLKEDKRTIQKDDQETRWGKKFQVDPEAIVENMTGFMFKGILIFGIPYFFIVLIKF